MGVEAADPSTYTKQYLEWTSTQPEGAPVDVDAYLAWRAAYQQVIAQGLPADASPEEVALYLWAIQNGVMPRPEEPEPFGLPLPPGYGSQGQTPTATPGPVPLPFPGYAGY
jgi:hypothetical protein